MNHASTRTSSRGLIICRLIAVLFVTLIAGASLLLLQPIPLSAQPNTITPPVPPKIEPSSSTSFSPAMDLSSSDTVTRARGFSGLVAAFYDNQDLAGFIRSITYTTPISFNLSCSTPPDYASCKLIDELTLGTYYSVLWQGNLLVPASGVYTFTLANVDDGARLYLDGNPTPLIDVDWNDAPTCTHAANTSLKSLALSAGIHIVRIDYQQCPYYIASLQVRWAGPGFADEVIPVATIQRDQRWGPGCPLCGNTDNSAGGPIITFNGNYNYVQQDLSIPALGQSIQFKRSYNAQSADLYTNTSPLGYGWTHNYNIRLITSTAQPGGEAGVIIFQSWTGGRFRFLKNTDSGSTYQALPGIWATLTRTPTAPYTYTLKTVDQTLYTFNAAGLPVTIRDPHGNTTNLTYSGTQLIRVADVTGQRYLNFGYDGQGRVITITDPISRMVQLGYSNNNLSIVTDTRNFTWTYTYTGTNNHLLYEVHRPQNTLVERTDYDQQTRAVKQWTNVASQPLQIQYTAITDTDGFPATTVIMMDPAGHVTTDTYDTRGTLIAQGNAVGTSGRTYDAAFNWTSATDANNHQTGYTFLPATGQPSVIRYAAGFSTTLGYDALNNLTRTVDARGFTTTYRYSGTLLISQTNALAQTTIYTYGQNNLLIAQQDPLGRITRYGYNTFGERIAITDALTNVTRFGYDLVGRLISTTVNAGQPAYERTTLNRYDPADNLISTTVNFNPALNSDSRLYNLTTLYQYDGASRQLAITDTIGRITVNYYNDAGQLISTAANFTTTPGVDPNLYNLTTRYSYDPVGNRILVTDTRNLVTKTDYDNLNRPVTVTTNYLNGVFDPAKPDEDILHVTHYDPAGNVIEQIEPASDGSLSRIMRTWYDTLNRPITVTRNYVNGVYDPARPDEDLTTVTTYDFAGNAIAARDPLSRTSAFGYDPLDRLITTTNALTGTTRYQYDGVGNRLTVTDVLTRATRYEYDKLNRLITTTFPYTGWVVNTYDPAGNRTRVTDALGHSTVYTYNLRGQLIAQTDAMSGTTTFEYDRIGNRVAMTEANGSVARYAFDIAGQLLVMTQSYTTTAGIDPNTYNLVTRYRYDQAGNVISTTNPLTATTVYTYDALNRLIGQSDALGRTWNFRFDALGNRTVITDANRQVTQYQYDKANRITAIFYPTDTVRYQYDAIGNRLVMTDALGVTTFRYDALNRLLGHTDSLRQIISNTYDAYGNVIGLRYPDGKVVSYTFDANNRLSNVRDWNGRLITYTYDRVGRVITQELPNNITTGYRYDNANRLIGLTMRNVGWTLGAYTYTLDALGHITQAEEYLADTSFIEYLPLITNNYSDTMGEGQGMVPGGTPFISPLPLPPEEGLGTLNSPLPTPQPDLPNAPTLFSGLSQNLSGGNSFPNTLETTFESPLGDPGGSCSGGLPTFGSTVLIYYTHDPLGRLTDAFYSSGACFRYRYDAGGNVTMSEETITSTRLTTYAYDVTSRLQTSKVNVEGTPWYYRFDGNGNLVEMTPNGSSPGNGALRYTYNAANQLSKIETHNGSAYATLAQMAYDGIGSRVVLTGWVSGVAYTTTYASRIAGTVQILQATSGANSTAYLYGLNQIGEFGLPFVYYLTDGAGSVRQLVDSNGAVLLARLYEPFGQVLMQKGTGDPLYGYLGAQFDRISGLLYINGAYYDPVTGRFLTPSNGGSNPYVPLSGAALAPVILVALIARRKKGRIWTGWLVLAMMASVGLGLAACGNETPTPPQPQNPPRPGPITTPPAPPLVSTPSATPVPPTAVPLPPTPVACPIPPTSTPYQIVLPSGMSVPPNYPASMTADPDLLEGWLWLYNTTAGRSYAELILNNNIQFEWASGVSGPTLTCSGDTCTVSGPIRLSDIRSLPPIQRQSALAGIMGHETYHFTQPFGRVKPSLYEEYLAYHLQDQIQAELAQKRWAVMSDGSVVVSGLTFAGYDPLSLSSLRAWFEKNNLRSYRKQVDSGSYTNYPPGVTNRE